MSGRALTVWGIPLRPPPHISSAGHSHLTHRLSAIRWYSTLDVAFFSQPSPFRYGLVNDTRYARVGWGIKKKQYHPTPRLCDRNASASCFHKNILPVALSSFHAQSNCWYLLHLSYELLVPTFSVCRGTHYRVLCVVGKIDKTLPLPCPRPLIGSSTENIGYG